MENQRSTLRREEDRSLDDDLRLLACEVRTLTERVVRQGVRLDQHMHEENEALHAFMDRVLARLDRIESAVKR
jgi:hypothetical protein